MRDGIDLIKETDGQDTWRGEETAAIVGRENRVGKGW